MAKKGIILTWMKYGLTLIIYERDVSPGRHLVVNFIMPLHEYQGQLLNKFEQFPPCELDHCIINICIKSVILLHYRKCVFQSIMQ